MSSLQYLPDFYSTPVKLSIKRPNTNKRYTHFNQTHFTAGDEEQFITFKKSTRPLIKQIVETEPKNLFNKFCFSDYSSMNTFRYIFYKFKKGIFIQIRRGKLITFLPFSNVYFVNEWGERVDQYTNIPEHSLPIKEWYTNNGLMRYESPCNETDTGHCHIKHMFEKLCDTHSVPDLELFINKRDFPILKRDGTEAYDNVWDTFDFPLVSHLYTEYTPICSMTTNKYFADITIPTPEDWNRVMYKENIHFAQTKHILPLEENFNSDWNNKISKFVFRGSSTGLGIDETTNMRIKLCSLYKNNSYFDVGITSNNTRWRKISGNGILQQPKQLETKAPLSLIEQSNYKYIIHIQGHSQAYRLSIEMAMYSTILLVKSDYEIWFEKYLEPWKHYVPVKKDLSDLDEKVEWCLNNSEKCREIAMNAREFYDNYLSNFKQILKELYKTCCSIHSFCLKKSLIGREKNIYGLLKIPKPPTSTSLSTKRTWFDLFHHPLNSNPLGKKFIKKVQLSQKTHILKRLDGLECLGKTDTHSFYIGKTAINSLLKYIPNFSYTFTLEKDYTIQENIIGPSLFDLLKNGKADFESVLEIIIQCLCALSVAQNRCFLTLYNVNPRLIRLKKRENEMTIDYSINLGTNLRCVNPDYYPVFTNYEDSFAIFDMIAIGNNQDLFNSFIDVSMMIGTTFQYYLYYNKPTENIENIIKETTSYVFNIGKSFDIYSFYKENKMGYFISHGRRTPHSLLDFILKKYDSKFVKKGFNWRFTNSGLSKYSHNPNLPKCLTVYKKLLCNVYENEIIEKSVEFSLPILSKEYVLENKIIDIPKHYNETLQILLDLYNSNTFKHSNKLKQYFLEVIKDPEWTTIFTSLCRNKTLMDNF